MSSTKTANQKTRFKNPFSQEVYESTYKFLGSELIEADEDIDATQARVAADLAATEPEGIRQEITEKFKAALADFKFVPGGRITSNAGTGLKGTSYINCTVSGPGGKDIDSMEGILRELRHQALILKSEMGYGFNADFMRPNGAYIEGLGVESPGAVKMLEMWDKQSEIITAGSGKFKKEKKGKGKIRKGAMMVTMSLWHPDIEAFVTAKLTPNTLSKFNMSVLVSDSFMQAVESNQSWSLEFPVTTHEKYADEWDGVLWHWKGKGYPTRVYKTFESAAELWDLITKSTYTRNEPGVLFVDSINRRNNLGYLEYINATNPCGEQLLSPNDLCLLGSINLTQFVDVLRRDWDYSALKDIIPVCVRMMDNVNDKSCVPLEAQRHNMKMKRRIGLGYMGYASALLMMRVRYGSEEALSLTDKLCSFVMNEAYRASAMLAKEKGCFPYFDKEKYLKSESLKVLSDEVRGLIEKYGTRNSHLSSIQPTGNSSIFANNVSGGLEPIFLPKYIRTSIVAHAPEDLEVPRVDWGNKEVIGDNLNNWGWAKEGDEPILTTEFQGTVFKIDRGRGLVKETLIKDYGVQFLEERGEWEEGADWAVDTSTLSIKDHVETMKVFSLYIDSAMSKTINIPNDYSFDDFKNVYTDIWRSGTIKGCTTYRAGTMTAVLSAESTTAKIEEPNRIRKTDAPRRPESLKCDVHQLTANGAKWVVLVGLLENDPYEVFAFRSTKLSISNTLERGELVKEKTGEYSLNFEDGWALRNLKDHFETDEQEALTRMISTSLRHGADVKFVVEQLMKSEGTVASFSKAVARTLKRYLDHTGEVSLRCENCNSKKMIMSEGCFKCPDCGSSKC